MLARNCFAERFPTVSETPLIPSETTWLTLVYRWRALRARPESTAS